MFEYGLEYSHQRQFPRQKWLPRLQGRPQAPAGGHLALVWAWETGILASCLQTQGKSLSQVFLLLEQRGTYYGVFCLTLREARIKTSGNAMCLIRCAVKDQQHL